LNDGAPNEQVRAYLLPMFYKAIHAPYIQFAIENEWLEK
jgi:hypothetical protein